METPTSQPRHLLRVSLLGSSSTSSLKSHLAPLALLHSSNKIILHGLHAFTENGINKTITALKRSNAGRDYDYDYQTLTGSLAIPTLSLTNFLEETDCVIITLPSNVLASSLQNLFTMKPSLHIILKEPSSSAVHGIITRVINNTLQEHQRKTISYGVTCVLENWLYKPTYIKFKALVMSSVLFTPVSEKIKYSAILNSVKSEMTKTRNLPSESEDGGGKNVGAGVHLIRLMRDLFGEICSVSECHQCIDDKEKNDDDDGATEVRMVKGKVSHSRDCRSLSKSECLNEREVVGEFEFRFKRGLRKGRDERVAKIAVTQGWRTYEYDLISGCISVKNNNECIDDGPSSSTTNTNTPTTPSTSDSWMMGGASQSITESLRFIQSAPSKRGALKGGGSNQCFEEGARDVQVVDAMFLSATKVGSVEVEVGGIDFVQASPTNLPFVFCNNTGTTEMKFDSIIRPSSLRDIVAGLSRNRMYSGEKGQSLYIPGAQNSLHHEVTSSTSPSPISSLRIELQSHTSLLSFTPSTQVITIQPSLSLRTLLATLGTRGWTLPSIPILLDQTLGGAVSNGSHGSSFVYGTLSDFVTSIEVVLENGDVKVLEEDGEGMRVGRCSLGRMGIITAIGIKVVPMKYVVRKEVTIDAISSSSEDFEAKIVELGGEYDHIWIQYKIGFQAIAICLKEVPSITSDAQAFTGNRCWYPNSPELDALLLPTTTTASGNDEQSQGRKMFTMQYSYPLERLPQLLKLLKSLEGGVYCGRVVELKFLASSERTIFAPNSIPIPSNAKAKANANANANINNNPSGVYVCLNIWWSVSATDSEEVKTFEYNLLTSVVVADDADEVHLHYGKWHSLGSKRAVDAFDYVSNVLK